MAFDIDKHVPMPRRRGGRPSGHVPTDYPFKQLDVGDSFFVPGVTNGVCSAASSYERLHPGKRFATRKLDDDPVTNKHGTRVWRIR